MKFGILSDNHGRLTPVEQALELFVAHGVEGLIHCGDLGGVETLECLAGRPCWFVWGNTDHPEQSWRQLVQALGIPWPQDVPVIIPDDQLTIAVCHGHEAVFRQLCSSQAHNYVLHGHTHTPADKRVGKTRIINPGALHRARQKTVAILDTARDLLNFYTVDSA